MSPDIRDFSSNKLNGPLPIEYSTMPDLASM